MKKTAKRAMEDIAYLRKILSDSERIVAEKGTDYIVWGTLIAIGQGLTYLLVTLEIRGVIPNSMSYITMAWVVLFFSGWVFSILHVRDKKKKKGAVTFAEKIVASVWLGVCISITIITFVVLSTNVINPFMIDPIVCLFIGVAYFICSTLYSSRWMVAFAFGWWLGSIPMFMYPVKESFLVFGLMIVVLYVAPGIVFYLKHRER